MSYRCHLWKVGDNSWLKIWDYAENELIQRAGTLLLVACDENPEAISRLFDYYYKQFDINKDRVEILNLTGTGEILE